MAFDSQGFKGSECQAYSFFLKREVLVLEKWEGLSGTKLKISLWLIWKDWETIEHGITFSLCELVSSNARVSEPFHLLQLRQDESRVLRSIVFNDHLDPVGAGGGLRESTQSVSFAQAQ